MSDINWHTDMENCPNSVPILLKLSDGYFQFQHQNEEYTILDWADVYSRRDENSNSDAPYAIAWAHVE